MPSLKDVINLKAGTQAPQFPSPSLWLEAEQQHAVQV